MALKEEELRDCKDYLVGAIADQAKQLGGMPDPAVHEAFIAPIVRKIEVDAEDAPPPAPPLDELEAGPIKWDLETDEVKVEGEQLVEEWRPPSTLEAIRLVLRRARETRPDLRAAFEQIALERLYVLRAALQKHKRKQLTDDELIASFKRTNEEYTKKFVPLIRIAFQVCGDPRVPPKRKVMVT